MSYTSAVPQMSRRVAFTQCNPSETLYVPEPSEQYLMNLANIHQDTTTTTGAKSRHIKSSHPYPVGLSIYYLGQEPTIDTVEEERRRKGRKKGVQNHVGESAAAAAASHDL